MNIDEIWKDIKGFRVGTIDVEYVMNEPREIFINLEKKQLSKLTENQKCIIWDFFTYIQKRYMDASLSVLSHNNMDDGDMTDEVIFENIVHIVLQ